MIDLATIAAAGASALVGGLVGFNIAQRMAATRIARFRTAYHETDRELQTERNRMVRALKLIPPYSRNANGALQKVGKELRGETA